MKYAHVFLCALLLISGALRGQNICTNGNFETYTSLPNTYSQCCYATGWSSPSGICTLVAGTGSPEYYHTSGTGGAQSPNTFWATVWPHGGAGFEGIATWYPSGFREYIRRMLASPMVIGQPYNVSFWWTNANNTIHGYGANNLGAAFSTTALTQSVGNNIPVVPQCESSTVLYSTSWQLLSFTFTPTAAYQHICLGNFRNNAGTTANLIGSGTSGAYYYLDDVTVAPVVALPFSIAGFEGKKTTAGNVLTWHCETPDEISSFRLERSRDNLLFEGIATLNPGESNYSFTDANPAPGENFYRLCVTDASGNISFTETVSLLNDRQTGFNWEYAAHIQSLVILSQCTGESQPATVSLQNTTGETLQTLSGNCGEIFSFTTEGLSSGIYLVTLHSAEEVITRKIFLR